MSWEPFRIRNAKSAVYRWVDDVASRQPGFHGAFFHGSVNWLADADPLPPFTDIDVVVVVDGSEAPPGSGKFQDDGLLLDVSALAAQELESAEAVLGNSHLAGSFRGGSVIADPSGDLARLQSAVSPEYAKRHRVRKRCEHATAKILRFLDSIDASAPFPDQVIPWLFGTGVTTHVLLVAGLKNPTVRTRYAAARELLAAYERLDFHEELLDLLGCARMTRQQVERHLVAMAKAFDAASTVITSDFSFATDISANSRSLAIDGSQEQIDAGYHREAVFWIAVTYSRCQQVLAADAPAKRRDRFAPGYQALLADLGIASPVDIASRAVQVRAFLPRLHAVADEIIAANPEIED